MQQYLNLLNAVLTRGVEKSDRTGVGTRSLFGYEMRFDLLAGFPLLTTKKLHIRSIIYELLWMLKGDTNIRYLNDNQVRIWNEWANESGDLGPVYGQQWRSWLGADGQVYDQIAQVIHDIQHHPDSRRLIVSAWNVADLPRMALPPCHLLFQFYVANGRLSCKLTQRSADIFLGLPFNLASYSMLTHMMAQQCGLLPGEFVWSGGDVHLYNNHVEAAQQQLERQPRALPQLTLKRCPSFIDQYMYEDFEIKNYHPHSHIKAVVAV